MSVLDARQAKALSRFSFDLLANGQTVGSISWPMLAQATNARLQWHDAAWDGSPKITLGNVEYAVMTEYLRRGFENDARITVQDAVGRTHASATLLASQGTGGRAAVTLETPRELRLVRRFRFLRAHFDLEESGRTVGAVFEPQRVSLKRRLRCEVNGNVSQLTEALLLYLAIQRIAGT